MWNKSKPWDIYQTSICSSHIYKIRVNSIKFLYFTHLNSSAIISGMIPNEKTIKNHNFGDDSL